jgi:flagellar hook protein FlgE
MLRSMYSAISGMDSFQTKLDVIGNNIANVDTIGFKSGRTNFSSVLSQTVAGGSAPVVPTTTPGLGGVNPQQVGLGVKVAGIQNLFTQGADQSTGNPLDVAINGGGFFAVSPNNGTNYYYTRQGDFTVDSAGNLVLPNGMKVLGMTAPLATSTTTPALTPININNTIPAGQTVSSTPDTQISSTGEVSVLTSTGTRVPVGYIPLATFSNNGGLSKVGDSMYQQATNSGTATYNNPDGVNAGTMQSGFLEMSNVDLTRQFSEMIVAQRGFDANSKMILTDNGILTDIVNLGH